jgi:hypothetical protein
MYGDRSSGARGYPSAAVQGMYEGNRRETSNVGTSEFNRSLFQKLKCRFIWYSSVRYSNRYNDYYDFKNSLNSNVSMRRFFSNRFD